MDIRRVVGSKVQIAGWTVYAALITALKLSVLSFYLRLTVRSLTDLNILEICLYG